MTGIGPTTDDGLKAVGQIGLVDEELRTIEEGGHSTAYEQRTKQAVDHQEPSEGSSAQKIAEFVLKLVTYSLYDERKQN